MKLFMFLYNPTGYNSVIQVEESIAEKVIEYIESNQKGEKKYNKFLLNNFDSVKAGLKGNYDDFYSYTELSTNESNIISPNEEKIKAFCAYINRLTN